MDWKILSIYYGSWLLTIGVIYKAFGTVADFATDELNSKISHWIDNFGTKNSITKSKEIFYQIFVKFFGEKHFSWRGIISSLLYSTLIAVIILVILGTIEGFDDLFYGLTHNEGMGGYFWPVIIQMYFQDYIALLKTRLILKWSIKSNINNIIFIIIVDLIVTVILTMFFCVFFEYILQFIFDVKIFPISYYIENFWWLYPDDFLSFGQQNIFLLTIYLGTFWLILIALSAFVSKSFSFINTKKNPIKSLGLVIVGVVTLGYLIGLPLYILFK